MSTEEQNRRMDRLEEQHDYDIKEIHRKLDVFMTESKLDREHIKRQIDENQHITDKNQEVLRKCEVYLDQLILRQARRAQLAEAIITKGIGGAFWAVAVFVGYALWAAIKEALKRQ